MVPAAYMQLDRLPLTPNGKLDRKALPAPDGSAYAAPAYEVPQGAIEHTIAAIWRELLDLESIGRHDNFFALGGHSLLAVRVASRLRQELGVEIGVAELFANATLKGLAACVASSSGAVLPAADPAIAAGCAARAVLCTTAALVPIAVRGCQSGVSHQRRLAFARCVGCAGAAACVGSHRGPACVVAHDLRAGGWAGVAANRR